MKSIRLAPALPTLVLMLTALLAAPGSASTPAGARPAATARLERSTDLPLVQAERQKDSYTAHISAVFEHPLTLVAQILSQAGNVCDIALLHFNIKACTYEKTTPGDRINFYTGRKFYQPAEQASRYQFQYQTGHLRDGVFEARLLPEGKAGSYTPEPLTLRATSLAANRTNVDIYVVYRDTFWSRLATQSYFATLGQGKKGFSITGTDEHGRPIYIDGMEGAIERNAARYYFAFNAFLATRDTPAHERFERRLNYWFDLTENYREQLHEMDKDAYLGQKRRERNQQLKLQGALDRPHAG